MQSTQIPNPKLQKENNIQEQLKLLSYLINLFSDFRSQVLTFYDKFISLLQNWKFSLDQLNKINNNQSLETKNQNKNADNLNSESEIQKNEKQFQRENYNYLYKLCNCFKEYNKVYSSQQVKITTSLNQLVKETQTYNPSVKIILTDEQQIVQQDCCLDIIFNHSNTLMISTSKFNILSWTFKNGQLIDKKILEKHKNWVNCLVYSKSKDVFFSGSDDKTIIIWTLKNNNWTCSQPFEKHQVNCLLLNKQENQLFSAGNNCSIIVWQVNLEENKLTIQQELIRHNSCIFSMSLNESEQTLVSCGNQKNEIIVWGKEKNNLMSFKQVVKQEATKDYFGKKLFFISENCFIWVPANKQVDKIFFFENKKGVFKENLSKSIQLTPDKENEDLFLFPIIKDKASSIIIVRHKTHIYFLSDINQGKSEILHKINCETTNIYGTTTNNFSHLIYWDNQTKSYSIYNLCLIFLFNN